MKFTEFPLHPDMIKGLDQAGYVDCTPVQESTLRAGLQEGRDIYAQSQTGTGKTAAFLVPILQLLMQNQGSGRFGLVLTPTRELALQVEKEAHLLAKFLPLKIIHILGGVEYGKQERSLRDGPDLIIATPGRLQDFVKQGVLNLGQVGYFVVDEADRMFDMGFQNEVLSIIQKMPAPKDRTSFLFSATLSTKVGNLVWQYMNNPFDIVIEPEQVTVDAIDQEVYHVGRNEKLQLLFGLIRKYQPRNIIIFSNTKIGATQIAKFFGQVGMECGVLEGNMPQNKRTRVVNNLIAGKISYLAATDVAARGLHVPNLDWVINFDLPNESENYVHRIGRTARAGCTGKAISFACERYVYNLGSIEKLIGKKITVAWPDEEMRVMMGEVESELRAYRKSHPAVGAPHKAGSSQHPRTDRNHHDSFAKKREYTEKRGKKPQFGSEGGDRRPRRDSEQGFQSDTERRPRRDGEQGFRPDAERRPRRDGGQGPRSDAERRPRRDGGQGPRSDAERHPRRDGEQGFRPDAERRPRRDGGQGPRSDAERRPRRDGGQGPRS
ncbi:MAG: DEAD/DEAH box helicase, partial [Spirochaetia bacterium]